MGLDNPLHIAFLVVILLLVFGAKRLPEIGRSLGSGMREFKDSVTGIQDATKIDTNAELPPPAATPAPTPAAPAAAPVQEAAPAAPAPAAAAAPADTETPVS